MPTEIKQANMLKEIISNRKLIWDLSKNDFKTRFAGSYLGIIWAFVQPIVTVLVYWFVFEKGMHGEAMCLILHHCAMNVEGFGLQDED